MYDVDLDEIASKLDYAKRYESYVVALCPFHDERRPSFFVYADNYRCESCGAFGKTSKLIEKLSGKLSVSHKTAPNFKNPFTSWSRDRSLGETLKLAWQNGPSVYLRERGINDKTQKALGLGYLENWVTFPIRNRNGKIRGAIARAGEGNQSPAKYVIPANQDQNLLYIPSWKRIQKKKVIYLTFGILDAVSLYCMGAASISTTCGMRMDVSYLDHIRKRIIFIPDKGEEESAQRFAKKMGWRGAVMPCNWPEKCKDVSDIFVSEYKDELLSALDLKDTKRDVQLARK
jgi:DNA primase